jgi:5'(3')-deoxyribonucleotidase
MKKQTIAVDVDDVLATSADGWVRHSNQRWGTHLTVDDYQENWGAMWNVDHEEFLRRRNQLFDEGVIQTFAPYLEAKAVLVALGEHYKLVITSSRNSVLREDTLDWLNQHFGSVFEEIHLAGIYDAGDPNAHLLTKAGLLTTIGADFLIDDQPKHCLAAAEAGMQTVLFGEYPWNRDIGVLPTGVTRCKDWAAIQEYFDGLGRS